MKSGNKLPVVATVAVVVALVGGTILLRGNDIPGAREVGSAGVDGNEAAPVAAPMPASPPVARAARPAAPLRSRDEELVEQVAARQAMREEHAARMAELRERSAARYAGERVDAEWAPVKEVELSAIADRKDFAAAGAKPISLEIDCRSTMCRLDGQFSSRGQAEDWVMMYTASVGEAMPNSVVSRSRNPDGSTRVEIYGRAR